MITTVLPRALLERLITARYLLMSARSTLVRPGPFFAGRATLQLHDATEMFLRIAAEHLHSQVKRQTSFELLVEAVAAAAPCPLSHRTALNQLNEARVAFKHFGLEPKTEDVGKLLADMETFFPQTCQVILGVDLSSASLRSLVGHRRTENWLKKAEELIQAGDFETAISRSAVAFAIVRRQNRGEPSSSRLSRSGRFQSSELKPLVDEIESKFKDQQAQLDLFTMGIDLAEYRRFLRYTPAAVMTLAGTVVLQRPPAEEAAVGLSEATFCLQFVIDAALSMRESRLPPRWPRQRVPSRAVTVSRTCDMIVWPCEKPEVVRQVAVGEELWTLAEAREESGHVPVFEDDERYFVPADALQNPGQES